MSLKVYLAGSSRELDDVKRYMAALRDAGIEITADWVAAIEAAGDANPADDEVRRKASDADLDGVDDADIVWLMVPREGSAGAWVELGYAIAHAKTIVVSGEYRKCTFTVEADVLLEHHEAALAWIIETSKPALCWRLTFGDGTSLFLYDKTEEGARTRMAAKQTAGETFLRAGKGEETLQSLGPVVACDEAPPVDAHIVADERRAPGA